MKMARIDRLRQSECLVMVVAALLSVGGWILLTGKASGPVMVDASQAAQRRPSRDAQLVGYETLPAMDGEMCQWVPASSQTLLATAIRQERLLAQASAAQSDTERAVMEVDLAPVRVIRDTYPTYSAVAVDPVRNEIILQDENLFQVLVFDSMANTPPSATMTEQKRVLGGDLTKLEFNCGLYVDPKTGDIYSVNNDTTDTMVIFSRNAQGNVKPDRELYTPHRTYGVAVDEEAQELYLTVEHPPQVVAYRKMASGDEKPLRSLAGPSTQLEDAHGITIDTKNQLMYVSNHGHKSDPTVPGGGSFEPPAITVYPLKASGDVAPLRVIEGLKTQLNWPAHIYLDTERQELYVANDGASSILVFRAGDKGNVAPIRAIKGPKTGLKNPTGVQVVPENNEVVVANMGNHSATVYSRDANGDVAPLRTIRSAPAGKLALAIGNPGGAGYDSKREEILVPN